MTLRFSTRLFLVLLQLAIGWHLFYEGIWKLRNPSWTSQGYLRNASGPFGLALRWTAGDPEVTREGGKFVEKDQSPYVLERFTVKPFDPAENPEDRRPHKHLPEPVRAQWQAYYDAFVKQYKLDDADHRDQLMQAEARFTNLQNDMVWWLTEGTIKVKRPGVIGSLAETETPVPNRVKEYLARLEEVKALQAEGPAGFDARQTAARVSKAQREADAIRMQLLAALDEKTQSMKGFLRSVLTTPQRMMGVPQVPEPEEKWGNISRLDTIVKWGLVIAGGALLLGLFTRTGSLLGVVLLLMFYLAQPPLPGALEPPGSTSHFLLINNNIIEALALLVIATSQPWTRYGLDVWLAALSPWRAKDEAAETAKRERVAAHAGAAR
jgi:uncharacterized membrane protein YphA (DoxX/SURF4 family)